MKSFILAWWLLAAGCCFAQGISWQDIGGENRDINAVLISPDDSRIIYIASGSYVLKTESAGKAWDIVYTGRSKVNFLSFGAGGSAVIFAGTQGNGLFRSDNQGKNWRRIFYGKNAQERDCLAAAEAGQNIYLGTRQGLFLSRDNAGIWHKAQALTGSRIFSIAVDKDNLAHVFVACVDGVFATYDAGDSWQRIFIFLSSEENNGAQESVESEEQEEAVFGISYLVAQGTLYLAASKGVYESNDQGRNWRVLPGYGLLNPDVRFLAVGMDGALYAVSKTGIFQYSGARWEELSFNLSSSDIRSAAVAKNGDFFAACKEGLFKNAAVRDAVIVSAEEAAGIRAVQRAAIEYAEVQPEKIIAWRKLAANKAFLPKVTCGVNRDTGDLWHWESGSTTKNGDDFLMRGRDTVDWDVSLSWDLGEIIWNNDQTSIDVRSRLMVELRQDILDQVTRLYFERLRIKIGPDDLAKQLRLAELTAMLDGLTGGYFSENPGK